MGKDINLHSFNGPDLNGQDVYFPHGEIRPGSEISDTLKFTSRLTDFVGCFNVVYGGKEDCVDINNHCRGLHIRANLWVPQGKYLATIKGGSKHIQLSGTVRGHGKEVDIDIGNISDQSDDPTGPVYLNLTHENGDPITIRVINGEAPRLLNVDKQKYRVVLKTPSFIGQIFAKIVHQLRKVGLA
ncbi:MAG: hypothetical protein ACO3EH_00310 [Ilumatobacteraceae bacterium]